MKSYYEKKAAFHHQQWELAFEAGKDKAAAYHMQEYLNYEKMIKLQPEQATS